MAVSGAQRNQTNFQRFWVERLPRPSDPAQA
jgi:hypothetical protein